jgi:hypothetical protein
LVASLALGGGGKAKGGKVPVDLTKPGDEAKIRALGLDPEAPQALKPPEMTSEASVRPATIEEGGQATPDNVKTTEPPAKAPLLVNQELLTRQIEDLKLAVPETIKKVTAAK